MLGTVFCAALAAVIPAAVLTPSPRYVVSYLISVAGDSTAEVPEEAFPDRRLPPHPWQWRIFDPFSGRDTLFLALPSFPTRLRWDAGFRAVNTPWQIGSSASHGESGRGPRNRCGCPRIPACATSGVTAGAAGTSSASGKFSSTRHRDMSASGSSSPAGTSKKGESGRSRPPTRL